MKSSSLLLLLLLPVCACGDMDESCKVGVGCSSQFDVELGSVPFEEESTLSGARITACLDASCLEAYVPNVLDTTERSNWAALTPYGSEFGIVIEVYRNAQLRRIDLTLRFGAVNYEVFAESGVTFSADVVDAASATLISRRWFSKFATFEPNGPVCGPTCRVSQDVVEL